MVTNFGFGIRSETHQLISKFQFSVPCVNLEYVEGRAGIVSDLCGQLD